MHIRHISFRQDATSFLPDTIETEIYSCITPIKDENVITKHFPNSFYQTELNDLLQTQDITDIVICGMMTHMCVDATVRVAKDLGYKCTLKDACATKDLEFNTTKVEAKKGQATFLPR